MQVSATIKSLVIVLLFISSPTAYTKETSILVYGDSISAAYGMEVEQGWVHLLAQHLGSLSPDYNVINASVSGETTGGGLVRLPKALDIHQPDLVILELGGNDGLRGYPIDKISANLDSMVSLIKETNTPVLLIGMVLPPNYGRRYTTAFENVFSEVAARNNLPFVPFLLNGVATQESLLQRDGIHPKPEAQPMLLNDIWQALAVLLDENPDHDFTSPAE
ncbi:MAG: arylesterase [Pseudomonadales bacterium]|nr:arylesterase [Pseudomonadales bacterium]